MDRAKDEPAFPDEWWDEKQGLEYHQSGMTLRDYFAAQALIAMDFSVRATYTECAEDAYKIADCMLRQRASQLDTKKG